MAADYSHSFCFTVIFLRVFFHPCACVTRHGSGMLHKSEHSLIKSFSPVLFYKMGKEICSISSAAFPDCSSFSAQHEDILKNRAPWDTDCQKTRPVLTFEKYCHRVTATTFHSTSSQSFLHLISICSPGEPLCCLITRAHTPSSR